MIVPHPLPVDALLIVAVTDHARPSLVGFVARAEASRHPNRVSETISELPGEVAE